jgi:RecA/RadA recombinase
MKRKTKPIPIKRKPLRVVEETPEVFKLSDEMKARKKPKKKTDYDGNTEMMVSTGSTLLDLAISGGRKKGGGIPGGIMVVGYGPSGTGKTVLACEVAGAIARKGGAVKYRDSEARLNKKFAKIFDLDIDKIDCTRPDIIPDAFKDLFKWEPDEEYINGYIIDSLAALSTSMEMDNDDGDKMGMRRAKEFSEHLRKCARIIADRNLILFCTNQIREKHDANKYERKDINPGGKAIEFYSSLILRFTSFSKIKKEIKIKGKKVFRVVGIEGTLEVDKSSIWKPHRTANITIYFDYGIDDIRENLTYIKKYTGATIYYVNNTKLKQSLEESIEMVEELDLEKELKEQVITLWEEIEEKFTVDRKKKKR